MAEDRYREITDLYQLSSQEKPAAHADQAVMDQVRKSVRRRPFSPFGNRWVAGGAVAVVAVMSVLLIQMVSQQRDHSAPARDAKAPLSDVLSGVNKVAARVDVLPPDRPLTAEQMRQARDALKTRFLDREELQAMEESVREQESRSRLKPASAQAVEGSASTGKMPDKKVTVSGQVAQPPVKQAPALTGEDAVGVTALAPPLAKSEHAGTAAKAPVLAAEAAASAAAIAPTGKYYLQAGSFRRTARANRFKAELAELGFISDIKAASIKGKGIYYRVRVGPFADRVALAKSRQKLDKLGIETRTLTDQE